MTDLIYSYIAPTEQNRMTHMWTAVGASGGVHIWAMPQPKSQYMDGDFYGGVEVHSRTPMYGDQPAHNENCWLLGCPCWHDGSSLYFSDYIEPMLRGRNGFSQSTHEYVNSELLSWYKSKFRREVSA